MAEKILSQDEVEALLHGVSGGDVETESDHPKEGAHQYDLTTQERIIRGRMPSLEIINERFSRFFQSSLSTFLKKEVEIIPVSIDTPKFGELMRKIPLPSSINLIKMDPLRGTVFVILDAKFVYRLVDLYFGGDGQTYVKIEGRDFTAIETRLISKVIEKLYVDMTKAWEPVFPINITHLRHEINPQFAQVVSPQEVVVTTLFKIEIEAEGGDLYIGLPYPTIEPIREQLYGSFQSDRDDKNEVWSERFLEELVYCPLNGVAEIGSAVLSIKEVTALSVGDVIMLNRSVVEDLEFKVEGKTIFYGKPGLHRGNVSFQISSMSKERKS